jgi:hypothetical protein
VTVFSVRQFDSGGVPLSTPPQSNDLASSSVPSFTERGSSVGGVIRIGSPTNYLRVEMSFQPDAFLSGGTRTSTIYEAQFVLTKI